MKFATSSSLYDSASSRAHAPQAGAAEKSISRGFSSAFACARAASTSLIQLTSIVHLLLKNRRVSRRMLSWQGLRDYYRANLQKNHSGGLRGHTLKARREFASRARCPANRAAMHQVCMRAIRRRCECVRSRRPRRARRSVARRQRRSACRR